jgi:hypothetical protein
VWAPRADERNDLNTARAFLERSVALSEGGLQVRSLLLLADVLGESGEYIAAFETAGRAGEIAEALGDRVAVLRAELVQIINQGSVDSSQQLAKGVADAAAVLEEAEGLRDLDLRDRAVFALSLMSFFQGRT